MSLIINSLYNNKLRMNAIQLAIHICGFKALNMYVNTEKRGRLRGEKGRRKGVFNQLLCEKSAMSKRNIWMDEDESCV